MSFTTRDRSDGRRWFGTAVFVFCILSLVFLLSALSSSATAQTGTASLTIEKATDQPGNSTEFPFTTIGQVGGWGDSNTFWYPKGVGVDDAGNIYVPSRHSSIWKFDPSGTYVLGEWPFTAGYAADAAVDAEGNVFIMDDKGVRKYNYDDLEGGPVASAASVRSGSIALDADGNVYLANYYNHRIQKFDNDLNHITDWGTLGSGDSEFNWPYGVAVDSAGNVYVADTGNNRIQKRDANSGSWTTWGSYSGGLNKPKGIDVDSEGNVYVADTDSNRIQKFDSNGTFLTAWGGDSGGAQLNVPYDVAVDGDDRVIVVEAGSHRIQKFVDFADTLTKDTSVTYDILDPGSYTVREILPDGWAVEDITCNEAGGSWNNWQKGVNMATVTLADNEHVTCTFYDTKLNLPQATSTLTIEKVTNTSSDSTEFPFTTIGQVGGWGDSNTFWYPKGVGVDDAGNIYVPSRHSSIWKFDPSGTYVLGEWPFTAGYAADAAVDAEGNVFIMDDKGVRKYDRDGTFLASAASVRSGSIALDADGNVYLANYYNHRIQKFDNNLVLQAEWDSQGSGDGDFYYPYGVAVDGAGNVFVADTGNNRIQKFDSHGNYITQWSSYSGDFNGPKGIDVDSEGNVYVADTGNNRIQKFDSNGTFLTAWGGDSGGAQLNVPYDVAVDGDDRVIVVEVGSHRIQKFVDYATTLADGGSVTYDALAAGTYFIRETPPDPDHWAVAATCTGENPPPETDEVTVTLYADDETTCTFTNTLINDPPEVTADSRLVTVDEGQPDSNSGRYSDPDGDTVTLSASVGSITGENGTWNWTFDSSDGPDESQTVIVTAVDSYGAEGHVSFGLVVDNVAPSFEAGLDETLLPVQEGVFSRPNIPFTDPGADEWTGRVNWGDSVNDEELDIVQVNKSFDLLHPYADEGEYTVSVTVKDDDDGAHTDTFIVTVKLNTPPTAEAGGPYYVDEGGSVPLDGSGSADKEQDPATLIYEWDLDFDGVTFNTDATGPSPPFDAANLDGPGSVTVALRVTDDYGESDTDTADVTINNVAPTILSLTVPWVEPININEQASSTVDVTFGDPAGSLDEFYTCTFDMNSDGQDMVTVTEVTGTACSISLDYDLPGVYTVMVTVSDKDGGSDNATAADFIVVYDPEGGFVTGGGWIWSPQDACPRCPGNPQGKANFGFVSKYKKGASVPTGKTEFQFKAGDLNFHSSSYDWLVIAGANAKYKGVGTINGEGSFKFMLTATDADLLGGGKPDEFRIRIWDDNGLYYDNKDNLGDDEYGGTELSGGNIKIHKAKEK